MDESSNDESIAFVFNGDLQGDSDTGINFATELRLFLGKDNGNFELIATEQIQNLSYDQTFLSLEDEDSTRLYSAYAIYCNVAGCGSASPTRHLLKPIQNTQPVLDTPRIEISDVQTGRNSLELIAFVSDYFSNIQFALQDDLIEGQITTSRSYRKYIENNGRLRISFVDPNSEQVIYARTCINDE